MIIDVLKKRHVKSPLAKMGGNSLPWKRPCTASTRPCDAAKIPIFLLPHNGTQEMSKNQKL
jgi:hypothetical protein